jgi:hypothetical protein
LWRGVKFDGLHAAAVAWGPGQPLVMEEVEVAPPGAMEIRVKVVSTSVCRSDVTAWQSKVRTTAAVSPVAFATGGMKCSAESLRQNDLCKCDCGCASHYLTFFLF